MASQKILTTSLVPENVSVYTGIWQASIVLKLYWGTNTSCTRHVIAYESACSSFSFVSACFDVFKFDFLWAWEDESEIWNAPKKAKARTKAVSQVLNFCSGK